MSLFESKQAFQRPSVNNDDGPFIKPAIQHLNDQTKAGEDGWIERNFISKEPKPKTQWNHHQM